VAELEILIEGIPSASAVSDLTVSRSAVATPAALIISADDTSADGCPVLPKLRAFQIDRTRVGTLEWKLRDKQGRTIDLDRMAEAVFADGSGSAQELPVKLRLREAFGAVPVGYVCLEMPGVVYDAAGGVLHAELSEAIADSVGIFEGQWGVLHPDSGRLVASERCFLSIDRGLFGTFDSPEQANYGPPTIQEVRLYIRDHATENLLLQDVEFDAAEIVASILQPIRNFNESSPPLSIRFHTHNFPYRDHWMKAIQARLFRLAAAHYLRNDLSYQAGGVAVADKAKAAPYMQAAAELEAEWNNWRDTVKVGLNAREGFGLIGSPYGGMA